VGDCHYLYGNYMTVKRITFLQELLTFIGLKDRLHLAWISSAEAQRFVQVVTDFTEKIRAMGPNPLKGYAPQVPIVQATASGQRAACADAVAETAAASV